ncbi:hypothetical protein K5X82_02615 [Halosquirtibacter xylanolyticus]|uniref:hypothetical protein n=1 Tax=Halosquirtibacter xylanolyticus TaxID=3374599 RepID=UPI00374A85AE|nr:hypothetical protein K5X82_02615 [Prolixibacteraceae bacterium]
MKNHHCPNYKFRKTYDKSPKSILGRIWKWHTNFCPGWKAYTASLNDTERRELEQRYNLKHDPSI